MVDEIRASLVHYGHPFDDADRGRAAFYARCKLPEDVAYGLGTPGAARYAEAGLAHWPGPSRRTARCYRRGRLGSRRQAG